MGIRFACHVCSKRLNIKQELAGRRGICPACAAKFRIPLVDAETSLPIESTEKSATETNGRTVSQGQQAAVGDPAPSSVATADVPSIDLIDDDPTSTWYVRPPNGGQYGPATGEILRQWIGEGRVAATSLLWREGWPQWREAKEVLPELSTRLPDPGSDDRVADSSSDVTAREPDAAKRDAEEFGYGDPVISQPKSASESKGNPYQTNGRVDLGADRRSKTSRRTATIAGLTGLAIILVFALAFVLSR
jgi:hypothetical protein